MSNQKIARRELEAAYLTESSMELKVSQSMTCHLGGTKKDQENLPGKITFLKKQNCYGQDYYPMS